MSSKSISHKKIVITLKHLQWIFKHLDDRTKNLSFVYLTPVDYAPKMFYRQYDRSLIVININCIMT